MLSESPYHSCLRTVINIPEAHSRSAVRQGALMKRSSFRCTMTREYIISDEMDGERSIRDVNIFRTHLSEIPMINT